MLVFWFEGQAGLIQILGEDFLPEEQEKSKALGDQKRFSPIKDTNTNRDPGRRWESSENVGHGRFPGSGPSEK